MPDLRSSIWVGATLAFAQHEHLFVIAHTSGPPSDADWAEYVAAVKAMPQQVCVLVFSAGGGANAAQRNALVSELSRYDSKTAMVTDSFFVRGTVTAVSWFVPNTRAFSIAEIDKAMKFLNLSESLRAKAFTSLTTLFHELGIKSPFEDSNVVRTTDA